MPGWHAATQALEAAGKLRTVGIVQEQHPARTRLFMQWRGMDWPVMVDALNLLRLPVVPVTLLIDEAGIIRYRGKPEHLDAFLAAEPVTAEPSTARPPSLMMLARDAQSPDAKAKLADALFLWGDGNGDLDRAIGTYRALLAADPDHAPHHFRLGVALRQRYDTPARQAGDFAGAVEHWGRALALDPNQYIWRRRIQQYGPRLDKPYPFYDWVEQARSEIAARGETPVSLPVEPQGAEIAQPTRAWRAAADAATDPDPEGRIHRDERGFIQLEQTVVPAAIPPGESARVHLVFRPNTAIKAHWNNEVDGLTLWLDPPAGWQVDSRRLSVPNPPEAVSEEVRHLELEVRSPQDWTGTATLPGYALYYVCEDVRGTCLYRRQDVAVSLVAR